MLYSGFGRILVLVVLVGLFLFGGTALAVNDTVTVTLDASGNLVCTDFGPLNAGDILTVINETGKSIQARFNNGLWVTVPANQSTQFTGTNDCDVLRVYLPAKGKSSERAAFEIGGPCNPIPTLSEWAMIVFGLMLMGLMTYYVIRRRRLANSVVM